MCKCRFGGGRAVGAAALLTVGLVLSPWWILAGPAWLADFVHREMVYSSIVHRIDERARTESEFLEELFRYVQTHLIVFPGQKLDQFNLSEPPLAYLLLQSGWCDQQGGVLLTLAQRRGISGKLLILRDESEGAAHVVTALVSDGETRIVDPYYGLLFVDPDGRPAPMHRVIGSDFRRYGYVSPQYEGAILYANRDVQDELTSILSLLNKPGEITDQYLTRGVLRKVVSRIVGVYHDLFGLEFVRTMQSLYFYSRSVGGYERARYMQLAGRFPEAVEAYVELLEEGADSDVGLPGMIYSPDRPRDPRLAPAAVRFSLGQALWSAGSYRRAESEFRLLVDQFPDSGWAAAAGYFLGDIYLRWDDAARARQHWLKLTNNPSLPALDRLYETPL